MEALTIKLAPHPEGDLINDQSLAGLQQMLDAHSEGWALSAYQVVNDEEMTLRMAFSLVEPLSDAEEN